MGDQGSRSSGRRRPARPLDSARLEELALTYVARFSTSAAKFERYLMRKLRERGWEGEGEPPVAATVARFVEAGYIDDRSYARIKTDGLLRRGYGARRVRQALGEAGIAEALCADLVPGERAAREAAHAYARRRRFGPFGAERPDPARREKQLAAMLRAGHGFDAARTLVDAPSEADAARWLAEAPDEEDL